MGRWEPDARGRLRAAAMELYQQRGFEQTTVTDIAEKAGVTERTFFRHFSDKREVLFTSSTDLIDLVVAAIASAPADLPAIEVVGTAMEASALALPPLDYARQRASVIAANASLHERELLKMSSLGTAVGTALRERGVVEPAASLLANSGVTVFSIGFERWISGEGPAELALCIREAMSQLRAITA